MHQVVIAEQQQLLVRELRSNTAPLETKPIHVTMSDDSVQGEREGGRLSRSSNTAHFKYPTDPLWSKQWSLVSRSVTYHAGPGIIQTTLCIIMFSTSTTRVRVVAVLLLISMSSQHGSRATQAWGW